MFLNPFSFKGRIRKTEYWLTYIIYVILSFIYWALSEFVMYDLYNYDFFMFSLFIITILFYLPFWYILIAQSVKRSHDIGNSGWFILIPFYGLFLLFGNSDEGDNKYGSNPKI